MNDILEQLQKVLDLRRQASAEESYVASLHGKGLNKILQKLGEECTETIVAAKDAEKTGNNKDVIHETADLWFHSLIMLSHLGENHEAVLAELQRRFGVSGHDEKASRSKSN